MFDADAQNGIGEVQIFTSTDGGHNVDQLAEMALNKIIGISDTAPQPLQDQALEYRDKIKEVLMFYFDKMAQSERTTIWALMKEQGHEDVAEIIRRL